MGESKKLKSFYEPITDKQKELIICLSKEYGENLTYQIIENLIDMPSIRMLSKGEASYIIDKLKYDEDSNVYSKWLRSDNQEYALMYHIEQIRNSAKIMKWSKEQLLQWLNDKFEIKEFSSFDRKKGYEAFKKMYGIHVHRLKGHRTS